jgi:exodeoxyribonuclease VII small subunit
MNGPSATQSSLLYASRKIPPTAGLRREANWGVVLATSRRPTMPTKTEKNSPTLETAMQRVSEIVASMESGDMPLEKLIESYEEGIGLVKSCQEKLDAAEKRIQIIARNARGEVSLEDFDAEAN